MIVESPHCLWVLNIFVLWILSARSREGRGSTRSKIVDEGSMWEICAADVHDSRIQVATNQACKWPAKNMMNENSEKTKEMIISFSRKRNDVPAVIIDQ